MRTLNPDICVFPACELKNVVLNASTSIIGCLLDRYCPFSGQHRGIAYFASARVHELSTRLLLVNYAKIGAFLHCLILVPILL